MQLLQHRRNLLGKVIGGFWERVMYECDGDNLYGTFTGSQVTHFNKDGHVDWVKASVKAVVVSASTGEIFKVSQYSRHVINEPGETSYFTFHQNFVGNMGTHYQIAVTFEIDPAGTWKPIREKAHCF
ncbi:hypothetical protein [Saccharicrinis sp. GN24d3]|uniref:hypothetical protein n=1 Tax=Saccharicrinis sp. GN24d3 TaxID=3458416 RepID=UPI004035FE6D